MQSSDKPSLRTSNRLYEIGHVESVGGSGRSSRSTRKWVGIGVTALIFLLFTFLVIWFFRWDQSNEVSRIIRSTGFLGVFLAIVLMAVISLVPVPSEFLMIVILKVFGPWYGILYSWVGTMLSAITTFWLARKYGRRLLKGFISDERLGQVSHWIANRGAFGLLLARIVPLPFIVVNYTAGISKEVKVLTYIWTTAAGGVPYYLGAALVFLGASRKYTVWIVVGGIAILSVWIGGYLYNRHVQAIKRWAH